MASTELSSTIIPTEDGTVTATVVDRISIDRLYLMMFRGSIAAQYTRKVDNTAVISRGIRDLLVHPFTED
jgi:hypothetical protein